MLKPNRISKIARDAAMANLASSAVSRVISEATTDSEGRDALRITIVIHPDALGRLTGDSALDTLVQIQEDLREAGEQRFPIVEYATEKELQESGDS
jgi:hypothetical protein